MNLKLLVIRCPTEGQFMLPLSSTHIPYSHSMMCLLRNVVIGPFGGTAFLHVQFIQTMSSHHVSFFHFAVVSVHPFIYTHRVHTRPLTLVKYDHWQSLMCRMSVDSIQEHKSSVQT